MWVHARVDGFVSVRVRVYIYCICVHYLHCF